MKSRQIYLYYKNVDEESLIAFLSSYPELTLLSKQESFLKIAYEGTFEIESFQELRELSMQELYLDFVAFVQPQTDNFPMDDILFYLPRLSPGVYTIESLIPEIIFLKLGNLKMKLKEFYLQLLGTDTIDSILGFIKENQNASQASKRLYMHRNTLNYRLDHFIEKTQIDVRTFKGALAVYLLFRA